MSELKLTILGSGSALPKGDAFHTSQVLEMRNKQFMIDCGEGAQIRMRQNCVHTARLNHIFISHLHGDHCFGLIGLISTLGMLGRTAALFPDRPSVPAIGKGQGLPAVPAADGAAPIHSGRQRLPADRRGCIPTFSPESPVFCGRFCPKSRRANRNPCRHKDPWSYTAGRYPGQCGSWQSFPAPALGRSSQNHPAPGKLPPGGASFLKARHKVPRTFPKAPA